MSTFLLNSPIICDFRSRLLQHWKVHSGQGVHVHRVKPASHSCKALHSCHQQSRARLEPAPYLSSMPATSSSWKRLR